LLDDRSPEIAGGVSEKSTDGIVVRTRIADEAGNGEIGFAVFVGVANRNASADTVEGGGPALMKIAGAIILKYRYGVISAAVGDAKGKVRPSITIEISNGCSTYAGDAQLLRRSEAAGTIVEHDGIRITEEQKIGCAIGIEVGGDHSGTRRGIGLRMKSSLCRSRREGNKQQESRNNRSKTHRHTSAELRRAPFTRCELTIRYTGCPRVEQEEADSPEFYDSRLRPYSAASNSTACLNPLVFHAP
jgi:hypothetical protein